MVNQFGSSPSQPWDQTSPTFAGPSPAAALWRRTKLLAAALVCSFGIGAAVYFLRPIDVNGQQGLTPMGKDAGKAPGHFIGWYPRPDLAIVVSGQMHGHLEPCGCSEPQLGGLTRRYNFMESLRAKGWPLVGIDVGEIAQSHGPQSVLKYQYSMRALKVMDYSAMGIGKIEFNMPFAEALGQYALNHPLPAMLGTNLDDKGQNFVPMNMQRFKMVNARPQLGIFSVVDADIERQINDPQCKFVPAAPGLANVMLHDHSQVNILIYQGTDSTKEVGKFIAELNALRLKNPKIPQVPIILCLTADPEPPARAKIIGNTTVVSVGWKGRYVGVIGLFANGPNKGYSLRYELVPMGEEFKTPNNPALIASHPLMRLMEEYAQRVKDGKYIEKFPRGPHSLQVELKRMGLKTNYVGSQECKDCHPAAFKIWQNSKHSHAFAKLEKAKNPSHRQFDGECVACHTVGFQHTSGYLSPENNAAQNGLLKNVGCENCHGPGAAHIADRRNTAIHALMNPYSTTKRIPEQNNNPALIEAWKTAQFRKQDDFCQKCHDQENDVNWSKHAFQVTWQQIQHYKQQAPQAVPNPAAPVIQIQPGGISQPPLGPPKGIEIRPGDKK